MLELKLRLEKDGLYIYGPTGSYRKAKSLNDLPQIVADCIRDYSKSLNLYADNIPAKPQNEDISEG